MQSLADPPLNMELAHPMLEVQLLGYHKISHQIIGDVHNNPKLHD